MDKVRLPVRRKPGKQSQDSSILYLESLEQFAADLQRIQQGIDFQMSARGWCYILEAEGLAKGDFGWAQQQINEARKQGYLRPGFILEEDGHKFEDPVPAEETAEDFVDLQYRILRDAKGDYLDSWEYYHGVNFWADKDCFIQLVVEKSDLKSLFEPVCKAYQIPYANMRGWGSMEQFAVMAKSFAEHELEDRRPVLLTCGDFDPAGLCISSVLHDRFKEYARFTGWDPEDLTVERVGLNFDFIQKNKLTWIEGLQTGSGKNMADPEHLCFERNVYNVRGYIEKYGERKVEANAIVIVPELGRKMLEDAIARHVGSGSLEKYNSTLDSIKAEIKERLSGRLDADT